MLLKILEYFPASQFDALVECSKHYQICFKIWHYIYIYTTIRLITFLYNGYRLTFRGVNQPERDVDHPPPYSV